MLTHVKIPTDYLSGMKEFCDKEKSPFIILSSSLTAADFQTEERLIWQTPDPDDVIWALYAFTQNLNTAEMLNSA